MSIKYSTFTTRKEFFALDIYERRVAIARDVLLRLKLKLINPKKGRFIEPQEYQYGASLSREFVNSKTCEVCAKGAIVCSWFGNLNKHDFNSFSLSDFPDRNPAYHAGTFEVMETFGVVWTVLEYLFEGWLRHSELTDIDAKNYSRYLQTLNHDDRLTVLFKNLIRNKGKILIPKKKKKGRLIG